MYDPVGQVEFIGEFVGATIMFGDTDAEPLLEVIALESVVIEVDPRDRNSQETAVGKAQGSLGKRMTIMEDAQNG